MLDVLTSRISQLEHELAIAKEEAAQRLREKEVAEHAAEIARRELMIAQAQTATVVNPNDPLDRKIIDLRDRSKPTTGGLREAIEALKQGFGSGNAMLLGNPTPPLYAIALNNPARITIVLQELTNRGHIMPRATHWSSGSLTFGPGLFTFRVE